MVFEHDLTEIRRPKLLDLLVRIGDLANRSGPRLDEDASALFVRLFDEPPCNPLRPPLTPAVLLQATGHRAGADGVRRRGSDALQSSVRMARSLQNS